MRKVLPILLVALIATPLFGDMQIDNSLHSVTTLQGQGVRSAGYCYDNTNDIAGCNYFTSVAGRTAAPTNYHILQGGFVDSVECPGADNITGLEFTGCSLYYDFTNTTFPNNSDLSTLICFYTGTTPYCEAGTLMGQNFLIDQLQPTSCWIYSMPVTPFTLSGSFGVSQTFLQNLGGGTYAFPPVGSSVGPILAGPQFLHPLNAPPYGLDTTMVYNGAWGGTGKVLPVVGGVMPDPTNCYGGDANCPEPVGWWYGGYGVDANGACLAPYAGYWMGLTPEPTSLLLLLGGIGLVATRRR